ncbi:MAG TPA: AraC family transcriptional regulator [Cyclobacteriaceae bacterium]
MEWKSLKVSPELVLYVKNIFFFENEEVEKNMLLPFYADGYPGIIYQQADNGVILKPKNKTLSEFFLYGQTLTPIELSITGPFQLIAFQLYPFAAKTLLGINPRQLNDDCFDMRLLANVNVEKTIGVLKNTRHFPTQKRFVSSFLLSLIEKSTIHPDQRVQLAITLILNSKGKISLKELREKLHVTERTLERQFVEQTGIAPKQFIKIIQFNTSLRQLSEEEYSKLSDIAYENEYADQSHFIRMFKKFTGKTPLEFQKSV